MDRARQLRLARISNIFLSSPWPAPEVDDTHIFMQAQMAESQWARQQLFQHRCKTLHNRLARKCLSAWWDVLLDKHVSCPTFTAGRCKSRNGIVQDYLHLLWRRFFSIFRNRGTTTIPVISILSSLKPDGLLCVARHALCSTHVSISVRIDSEANMHGAIGPWLLW